LVQRRGDWAGPQPVQALLAVPNLTVTMLLYNGPLLCGFNLLTKG